MFRNAIFWTLICGLLSVASYYWIYPLTIPYHIVYDHEGNAVVRAPTGTPYIRRKPTLKYSPHYFQNEDNLWLYWTQWKPTAASASPEESKKEEKQNEVSPRGVIFFLAGLGDHHLRFQVIAQKLVDRGFVVVAMDHQGQGVSEGERSYVERFQHYVRDFIAFEKYYFEQREPTYYHLPRFLLGRSMGGLIATHVAYHTPANYWSGVILVCPAFDLGPNSPANDPIARNLALLASEYFPKLTVPHKVTNLNLVSRNLAVAQSMHNDHLRNRVGLQMRPAVELLLAMEQAIALAPTKANFRMLVLHGQADEITKIDGSKRFVDRAPTSEKRLIDYPGMWHDLFNDDTDNGKHSEAVFRDVVNFLTKKN